MSSRIGALGTVGLLAACAGPAPKPADAGPTAPFAAKLDSVVQDAFTKREMPGGALVVVQGDKIVYGRGFGYADLASKKPYTDTTQTVIGSTSKPLTALGVLRLVQLGKVALDTPVVRYLPDLQWRDPRAKDITLRHLLTNRSGMVAGFSGAAFQDPPIQDSLALERLSREMVKLPLLFAPGQGYAYSNRGWTMAGYVIQRVSGEPVEQFMRKEVFEPLGMTHTTLEFWKANLTTGYGEGRTTRNHLERASLSREYGPSGMVASTPEDMGKLLVAMLNDGKTVSGTQFLTPELIHEAERAQADATSELGGPTKYGLGWEVDSAFGTLTVKKAGTVGTMVSFWVMLPAQKTAVAFTFNREDYGILPVVSSVLKVIAGGSADPFQNRPVPEPPAPPKAARVAVGTIDRYLGTYDTRNGDMTFRRRGDSVIANFEGVEGPVVPTDDSTWVAVLDDVKNGGKAFQFRRQGGTITLWSGKDSLGFKIR